MFKILIAVLFFLGSVAKLFSGVDVELLLDIEGGAYPPDSVFESPVKFSNVGASEVQGWHIGVCHDNEVLTLMSVTRGSAVSTMNGGTGPDFITEQLLPDGYVQSATINFQGLNLLAPGSDYELAIGIYQHDMSPPEISTINFCDTLGDPPIVTSIVFNGEQNLAQTRGARIEALPSLDPIHTYRAGMVTGEYDLESGASLGNVTVELSIQSEETDFSESIANFGFGLALAHDSQYLNPISFEAADFIQTHGGPLGPDFLSTLVFPDGVVMGVLYSFFGFSYFFSEETTVAQVVYSVDTSTVTQNGDSVSTPLIWAEVTSSEGLSYENLIINTRGRALYPILINGAVEIAPRLRQGFIRGDCNGDNFVDVADGIWALNEILHANIESTCHEACDANSDQRYDVSDAIFIFSFRFLDGPAPAAPYPDCGGSMEFDCDFSNCP